MLQLSVDKLKPCKRLPYRIFDRAGQLLFETGSPLLPTHLTMLRQSGIADVMVQDTLDDEPAEKIFHWRTISLDDLHPGQLLAGDLLDEDGCRLAPAGSTVTTDLIQRLRRLDPDTLYSAEPADPSAQSRVMRFRRMAAPERPPEAPLEVAVGRASRDIRPATRQDLLLNRIKPRLRSVPMQVEPAGRPALDLIDFTPPAAPRDPKRRQSLVRGFEALGRNVERFFRDLRTNPAQDGAFVIRLVRRAFMLFADDPAMTMSQVVQPDGVSPDYLVRHSFHGCLVSMGMASVMKYGLGQVVEVGCSGLLHDVGMLKVPREVVEKQGRLDESDRYQIRRHPEYNLEVLQRFRNVPESVPYAAWQTHERADASGYPRGKPADEVHTFARIVAVADVFDALVARRPWREALTPHQAMVEVLKMVRDGKLANPAAKGLLDLLGLYPVGSVVELSDGSTARVISCATGEAERPVVSVLVRGGQSVGAPQRIDLRHAGDLTIVKELPEAARRLHRFAGF